MKFCGPRLGLPGSLLLAILVSTFSIPVKADTPNFGKLTLAPGFRADGATMTGFTGGSYSLSAISNRDRNRNICIGFADPKPDHILVLEKDFANLKLSVDSGGNDTTLLVKGPEDDVIRCGDDTGRNKDASIQDRNWKAGTYRVWVGTFNPGVQHNYNITVQQP
jgi:hypothetical protein